MKLLKRQILNLEREYETGMFYLRRKRPDAGIIYFESVTKNYPNTEWAAMAEEKIKMLKKVGAIR